MITNPNQRAAWPFPVGAQDEIVKDGSPSPEIQAWCEMLRQLNNEVELEKQQAESKRIWDAIVKSCE